jgi:hypothetical protein
MVNAILNPRPQVGPPRRRAPGPTTLDGVRRDHRNTGPASSSELALRGEVAYWDDRELRSASKRSRDQRADRRERLRLRSAKLLDASYRFVCECRICDRSLNGLKLVLPRNIRLPAQFAVHIDETREVRRGRMMWRRGLVLGVRLYDRAPLGALSPSDRFALSGRYYAIPD